MVAYTRLHTQRHSLIESISAQLLLLVVAVGPACAASCPGLKGMEVSGGSVTAAEHVEKARLRLVAAA